MFILTQRLRSGTITLPRESDGDGIGTPTLRRTIKPPTVGSGFLFDVQDGVTGSYVIDKPPLWVGL